MSEAQPDLAQAKLRSAGCSSTAHNCVAFHCRAHTVCLQVARVIFFDCVDTLVFLEHVSMVLVLKESLVTSKETSERESCVNIIVLKFGPGCIGESARFSTQPDSQLVAMLFLPVPDYFNRLMPLGRKSVLRLSRAAFCSFRAHYV